MSTMKDTLTFLAMTLRIQAGNTAVAKAGEIATALQKVQAQCGEAAAAEFYKVIRMQCNPTAVKIVDLELDAAKIVDKWIKALEQDKDAKLEVEFQCEDAFNEKSVVDDNLDYGRAVGVLKILLEALAAQKIAWQSLPRLNDYKVKIGLVGH